MQADSGRVQPGEYVKKPDGQPARDRRPRDFLGGCCRARSCCDDGTSRKA